MKNLLMLLLAIASSVANAQTVPLYVYDTTRPNIAPWTALPTPFDNNTYNIAESFIRQVDYPTMPLQGVITDLYFKLGSATPAGSKIHGLKVKMGHIRSNVTYHTWNQTPSIIDSFCALDATLTTVYYDSLYTLGTAVAANDWWRITLQTPFNYAFQLPGDITRNVVVQLSTDSLKPQRTFLFNIKVYTRTVPYKVETDIGVAKRNPNPPPCISYLSNTPGMWNLGFNPKNTTAAAEAFVSKEQGVYPNPATDRLFVNEGNKMQYNIISVSGMLLWEGVYDNGIDISALNKGIYFLRAKGKTIKFIKE